MRISIILVIIVGALMAYVRLAPTDVARWHVMPNSDGVGDDAQNDGYRAVRKMTAPAGQVLGVLQQTAQATEGTVLIAGSVGEGMMTFQTRSRIWGFPDHTTVAVQGDLLVIYGRLRFGKADLGVNKQRVLAWLAVLGPLTEPL
jgi:uncharacterized protein (DUF1499 family)